MSATATTVVESLAAEQRERAASRAKDYRNLVQSISRGRTSKLETVEMIIAAVGKSLDDLKRDVELHQKRVQLSEAMNAVPSLEAERGKLAEQIAAADSVLNEAAEKHAAAVQPLAYRVQQIERSIAEAGTARDRLFETCPDQDLVTRMRTLSRQRDELNTRARDLDRLAGEHRTKAREIAAGPGKYDQSFASNPDAKKAEIAEEERIAAFHEAKRAPLTAEIDALTKQIDAAFAATLQP